MCWRERSSEQYHGVGNWLENKRRVAEFWSIDL